jgi:hypothetical protein
MLALNRSLLNREYILMNVLKALAFTAVNFIQNFIEYPPLTVRFVSKVKLSRNRPWRPIGL